MFTRLGETIVRRTRMVLFGSVVALVLTATLGVGVFGVLAGGGFDDPSSESSTAQRVLEEEFGAGTSNLVLLVTAISGDIDDPGTVEAGLALTEELAAVDGVEDVGSYWRFGSPPSLRSEDGTAALVFARTVGDEDAQEETTSWVVEEFAGERDGFTVEVGGVGAVYAGIGQTVEEDLALAEMIAIPLTLVLLVIVFRGVVAALLPLAVGVSAIFGAFFVLWAIAQFTDVSIFSINLVTALGLGLAIDYSLLIVSRFREELDAGRSVEEATVRTVETAGRTVAFSGLTVAVSLVALVAFPLYFLRSFAYAGVGVLLVAMVSSVVTLPALLRVLGPRVNAWSLKGGRGRGSESAMWARAAELVLRRPAVVAVAVVGILVFVGAPFLRVTFGNSDERVLPANHPARVATENIQRQFASDESAAFPIVVTEEAPGAVLDDYAARVSMVDGVARVTMVNGTWVDGARVAPADSTSAQYAAESGTWMSVIPEDHPMSTEAQAAVTEIRAIDTPLDAAVAGETAQLIDTKTAIFSVAPWAGAWIAGATFVLLFLMFGSFLVPLKAIILNSLSLTATFGAMVWIFQDGNFSGLLDFTATGLTDVSMPILMFAIAFGLSMDYEVFLLARMKEEYDRTGDNHAAIVAGLAKTGRIVTAAALVLSVTFFAFASGGITFMKLFGLGLGIAVLVDAFLVRATLVPALMQMAGSANWWAPAWARQIHDRFGIDESGRDADPSAEDRPAEVGEVVEVREPVLTR